MSLQLHQRVCHRVGYDDKQTDSDTGFTLIEVVTSVAILATVSAAVAMAVVSGINASGSTNRRVTGANIAQADIEQARAQPTPSPTSYPTQAAGGGGSYTVTRTVVVPANCPIGSDMRIQVVVSGPGTSKNTVTMSTVLACGNP